MPTINRRSLLGAAALLSVAGPASAAFPEQPVRVIVPWNPGGLADILMRALAPAMAQSLGQPVVIENRAGANGAVGTQAVARAPADGHTLIVGNAETHAINPLIYPKLAYNPVTEFTPVTTLASGPFALITRPGLGVETLDAFLALVRRQPGKITFASWGIGSTSHLAMEGLIKQAKVEMLHIPFTGAAPASTALIAGQVDCMFLNAGPAEAAARDGRPKIIGIGAMERVPQLPDTPTLKELGLPVEAANWFGLLGPAGLAPAVASRLAGTVAEGLKSAQVQEIFRAQVALPMTQTPAEMQQFLAADRERWGAVVRDLNIRLE
ncbi:Bug family tripartite tricarboxylate transporter substrate binding protein [Belnapia rosea]|uniref:Tripartite-type tricarboxylate transporter, receptor component TctC n=1 Tax=Belnapia rosea TaxID=938405 RepID=A0A1G7CCT8_9PROT|nr:tripartite tricarboxylate transporter substrate binding protein [Belnapia rosea]SDE37184.1 Tripartite-type tricarboxylate transporter, receptor component TctC [Belnapia rosea]